MKKLVCDVVSIVLIYSILLLHQISLKFIKLKVGALLLCCTTLQGSKYKVTLSLCFIKFHVPRVYDRVKIHFCAFLIPAPDGSECSASCSGVRDLVPIWHKAVWMLELVCMLWSRKTSLVLLKVESQFLSCPTYRLQQLNYPASIPKGKIKNLLTVHHGTLVLKSECQMHEAQSTDLIIILVWKPSNLL